jgi:hypothetical protein
MADLPSDTVCVQVVNVNDLLLIRNANVESMQTVGMYL